MIGFILRRAALGALTLLVIVTLSFFMLRAAPGGPFDRERQASAAARAVEAEDWGLDRPLPEQYLRYLGGLARLDFGRSMSRPDHGVAELILPRLGVSLSLAACTMIVSLLVGVPAGLIAAVRRGRAADWAVMATAALGLSIPNFVIGPLLKWVFAIELGLLPGSRWAGPASAVLPVAALSAIYVGVIARLVRAGALEALGQDWVRAARARGLSERRVVVRHALPAAIAPVVAWLGPALAGLAVGSVVIERIFDIPGLGNAFVDAAFNRDYTLVMGTVIVYSALLIALNALADLALAGLDPRVRLES